MPGGGNGSLKDHRQSSNVITIMQCHRLSGEIMYHDEVYCTFGSSSHSILEMLYGTTQRAQGGCLLAFKIGYPVKGIT